MYLTDSFKKMYIIWRKENLDFRMYMGAKKLINQKKCIMKNKTITEMEIEEIKKELQQDQRSHVNKTEGERLQRLSTMKAGEQK